MGADITSAFYTSFRDSIVGETIHLLSGRRVLKPALLKDDYEIESRYLAGDAKGELGVGFERPADSETADDASADIPSSLKSSKKPEDIMVEWDGENDPENPRNWGAVKKTMVTVLVCFLTTSTYMASAIFTPAEEQMLHFFGTTQVKLMLGLTFFVWGYGIGPIAVSAMSESPFFGGRRYIFIVGQLIFTVLQIPTALSNHLGGFVVLRFLAGLATAPPLCVGPAALGDMYGAPTIAFIIVAYSVGNICGPFLGPLIGAALSHANSWRWVFWYLLMQGGLALALMLLFLPETSEQALLMRKAKRLRHLTGNNNLRARGDILKKNITATNEIKNILWLPVELCLREPVLDLINIHLSLLYAVIYLYFEAFPIVFAGIFNFTIVEIGVAYVGIMVGIFLAVGAYIVHLNINLLKPIKAGKPHSPEYVFGSAALVASFFVPAGLFIYGWSATANSHWMGPIIGGATFAFGTFILFQTYIAYLGNLYPTRFASAIASNTVLRSMIGGAFPLFGTVYFNHTGTSKYPVGWGCSILGFISVAMILLPLYFVKYGASLRERTLKKYGVIQ